VRGEFAFDESFLLRHFWLSPKAAGAWHSNSLTRINQEENENGNQFEKCHDESVTGYSCELDRFLCSGPA
jgi:hypothetical protein